jgi:hypothetical protein
MSICAILEDPREDMASSSASCCLRSSFRIPEPLLVLSSFEDPDAKDLVRMRVHGVALCCGWHDETEQRPAERTEASRDKRNAFDVSTADAAASTGRMWCFLLLCLLCIGRVVVTLVRIVDEQKEQLQRLTKICA